MEEATTISKNRPVRSEDLLPDELEAFKAKVESFKTKEDAIEFFGFSRVTLRNVLLGGSGKPSTIAIIRQKITIAA